MGRNGAVSGKYWNGKIDDVRIWNVVRASSDVALAYRAELTSHQPGLVANWKFNDGNGSSAADSAGGHVASLNGGASFSTDVHAELSAVAASRIVPATPTNTPVGTVGSSTVTATATPTATQTPTRTTVPIPTVTTPMG